MRPLTGVDALIQEISDLRARLARLENDPRRYGNGGATVPTAGAQFNPAILGTVEGTLPNASFDDLDDGLPALVPVEWSKVNSDYEIGYEGNRVQLNADGLWSLVTSILPVYNRFGHKPPSIGYVSVSTGGNLQGHAPAQDATRLPYVNLAIGPGGVGHTQIIGYGNSFAMNGAAGSIHAGNDAAEGIVHPTHFKITVELHRLIEG